MSNYDSSHAIDRIIGSNGSGLLPESASALRAVQRQAEILENGIEKLGKHAERLANENNALRLRIAELEAIIACKS